MSARFFAKLTSLQFLKALSSLRLRIEEINDFSSTNTCRSVLRILGFRSKITKSVKLHLRNLWRSGIKKKYEEVCRSRRILVCREFRIVLKRIKMHTKTPKKQALPNKHSTPKKRSVHKSPWYTNQASSPFKFTLADKTTSTSMTKMCNKETSTSTLKAYAPESKEIDRIKQHSNKGPVKNLTKLFMVYETTPLPVIENNEEPMDYDEPMHHQLVPEPMQCEVDYESIINEDGNDFSDGATDDEYRPTPEEEREYLKDLKDEKRQYLKKTTQVKETNNAEVLQKKDMFVLFNDKLDDLPDMTQTTNDTKEKKKCKQLIRRSLKALFVKRQITCTVTFRHIDFDKRSIRVRGYCTVKQYSSISCPKEHDRNFIIHITYEDKAVVVKSNLRDEIQHKFKSTAYCNGIER